MTVLPSVAMTMTQLWHRVPGGTATATVGLAKSIHSSGRVAITGIGPSGNLRRPRSLLQRSEPSDWALPFPIAQLPLPLPLLYDSWSMFGRPSIDHRGERDFDLVHLTAPVVPPRHDGPLVATVHDLFPITHPHLLSGRGVRLMEKGLRSIAERADKVLVSTKTVADEWVRVGFSGSQVEITPFGIDPTPIDDVKVREALDRYGLDRPYVMFNGTREPRKNIALIYEALVRLNDPGLALVLTGPPGWGEPSTDSAFAIAQEVPSPIIDLGFIPKEDLPLLAHGSVALCYPSLQEGFGLPVLEAMAASAVVITSGIGATAEVAGDAALLVDPHSAPQMEEAIRTAMAGGLAMSELRQAGLERSKRFTWSECAAATCDVYETVIR